MDKIINITGNLAEEIIRNKDINNILGELVEITVFKEKRVYVVENLYAKNQTIETENYKQIIDYKDCELELRLIGKERIK